MNSLDSVPKPAGQDSHDLNNLDPVPKPAGEDSHVLSDLNPILKRAREDIRISVSCDASKIILMCADRGVRLKSQVKTKKVSLLNDTFLAFTFECKTPQRELQPMKGDDFGRSLNYLSNFGGFGKFHFTSPKNRNAKDEVFITCDRENINIFNVAGKWEHIRQIRHAGKRTLVTEWHTGVEGISGKYVLLRNEDRHASNGGEKIISVYDLETGKLVLAVASDALACLSNEGCLMLCDPESGKMTTQRVESDVMLTAMTTPLEVDAWRKVSLGFIGEGSRIIAFPVKSDPSIGEGTQGMIFDATTLSIVDRVSYPTGFTLQRTQSSGTNDQYLYSVHGTKLDLIRIQDALYPHPSRCDARCAMESNDFSWDSKETVVSSSDLTITVVVAEEGSVDVWSSIPKDDKEDKDGKAKSLKILQIPPLDFAFFTPEWKVSPKDYKNQQHWKFVQELGMFPSDSKNRKRWDIPLDWKEPSIWRAHVDSTSFQLTVDCTRCVMVWKLPVTFGESVTLLSAFWVTEIPRGNNCIYQHHEMPHRKRCELKKCHHGRTYAVFSSGESEPTLSKTAAMMTAMITAKTTIRRLRCDEVFDYDPHLFFDGLFVLILLFDRGDNAFKEAVMRYIGLYINRTRTYKLRRVDKRGELKPEDFPETLLTAICRSAKRINYAVISTFLEALFESVHVRWVPEQRHDTQMNPIVQLLRNANEYPIVINLAQIMIKYCIRMAKEEQEWQFMAPVLRLFTMNDIAGELRELPPGLVPEILRTIAYFPVKKMKKVFVINHSIMIHPPRQRDQPIYTHRNPILQMDDSTLYKEYNPLNENTTRDLYVASFDLLWLKITTKQDSRSTIERIKRVRPPWWTDILLHLFLLKFKPSPPTWVVCNNFPLEILGHPVISALIEYKW